MKLSKGKKIEIGSIEIPYKTPSVKGAKKTINKTLKKLKSKKLIKKLSSDGNKLLKSLRGSKK